MAIVRYTMDEIKKLQKTHDKTDWERLRNMTDDDIVYDEDSPMLTPDERKEFRRVNPVGRPKQAETLTGVYIRLEPHTIERIRASGPGWQKRFRENVNKMVAMGMF